SMLLYLSMCFKTFLFSFSLSFIRCLFFFFSSRRRHTRSKRDWSSDVCSSDLDSLTPLLDQIDRQRHALEPIRQHLTGQQPAAYRSEERRVGKECRSRRRPCCHE